MPHHHLGRRVTSDRLPGLQGTVVYVDDSRGTWRRGLTCEVIWSDGSCTRRVPQETLEGPGWALLDLPKATPQECADMWHQYQLDRVALMQRNAARQPQQKAALPPSTVMGAVTGYAAAAPLAAPQMSAREMTAAIKERLAQRFPDSRFSVHCESHVAKISWLDGPVSGPVFHEAKQICEKAGVARVEVARAFSETLVQAGLHYCLERIQEEGMSDSEARRLTARATPQEYLSRSLEGVVVDCNGPASGLSLQLLARAVLARWDGASGRFVNTKAAEGLLREREAMFPHGDDAAAADFHRCLNAVEASQTIVQRALDVMRA